MIRYTLVWMLHLKLKSSNESNIHSPTVLSHLLNIEIRCLWDPGHLSIMSRLYYANPPHFVIGISNRIGSCCYYFCVSIHEFVVLQYIIQIYSWFLRSVLRLLIPVLNPKFRIFLTRIYQYESICCFCTRNVFWDGCIQILNGSKKGA